MTSTTTLTAHLRQARRWIAVVATTVVALAGLTVRPAQAQVVQRETVPLIWNMYNNCAPEEVVHVTGTALLLITTTSTDSMLSVTYHVNLQNASGVGLTSGDTYSFVLNDNVHFTLAKGATETLVQRVRLVRHGSAADIYGTFTSHFTVDAGGNVVVDFDRLEIDCTPSPTSSGPS